MQTMLGSACQCRVNGRGRSVTVCECSVTGRCLAVLIVGLMPVKPRARRLVRLREPFMQPHTAPRPSMGSARPPRPASAPAALSPGDEKSLLDQARSLQRAAAAGRVQPLLRGKNLGLLCADDTQPQALLFRQAASELGAHVAHIGMSLTGQRCAGGGPHRARARPAVRRGRVPGHGQRASAADGRRRRHRGVRRLGQQRARDLAAGRATRR